MLKLAPERLIDNEPLDLFAYLDGVVMGSGVFEDRFGRLRQRFHVTMRGTRKGDGIALDEVLVYGDGSEERRQWQLERLAGGGFSGRADDCVGVVTGSAEGGTAVLRYVFRLRIGGRIVPVRVVDRFYRINDRVVVDRARLSKWGVKLGELSLVYEKRA